MARRIFVTMDDDALALLPKLAGGERKQGAYLSELVRQAASKVERNARLAAELAEVRDLLIEATSKLERARPQ